MGNFVDHTGKVFGRLTALERIPNRGNTVRWLCLCVCGKKVEAYSTALVSGHTTSCGCYWRELVPNLKHSMSRTPIYKSWDGMIQRCRNPNATGYENYGGRGIKVCERWLEFANFLADMGARPAHLTLDRIDNDGNYEPSNCRWASRKQQQQNRRIKKRR